VKLEVVTIGTELLLGHTVDTNAAELGRALAAAGAEITRHTTVADRPDPLGQGRLGDTRGAHRA